jgi:hypothetical protein
MYYGIRIGSQNPFLLNANSLEDAKEELEIWKEQVTLDIQASCGGYSPEVELLEIQVLETWRHHFGI